MDTLRSKRPKINDQICRLASAFRWFGPGFLVVDGRVAPEAEVVLQGLVESTLGLGLGLSQTKVGINCALCRGVGVNGTITEGHKTVLRRRVNRTLGKETKNTSVFQVLIHRQLDNSHFLLVNRKFTVFHRLKIDPKVPDARKNTAKEGHLKEERAGVASAVPQDGPRDEASELRVANKEMSLSLGHRDLGRRPLSLDSASFNSEGPGECPGMTCGCI